MAAFASQSRASNQVQAISDKKEGPNRGNNNPSRRTEDWKLGADAPAACERCDATANVEYSEELGTTLCANCFRQSADERNAKHVAAIALSLPEQTDLGNADFSPGFTQTSFATYANAATGFTGETRAGRQTRAGKRNEQQKRRRKNCSTGRRHRRRRQEKVVKWGLGSQSDSRLRALLNQPRPNRKSCSAPTTRRGPVLAGAGTHGQAAAGNQADLISLGTGVAYDPDAGCPALAPVPPTKCSAATPSSSASCVALCGCALTGDTREHVLIVFHGAGANGKTTLIETAKRVARRPRRDPSGLRQLREDSRRPRAAQRPGPAAPGAARRRHRVRRGPPAARRGDRQTTDRRRHRDRPLPVQRTLRVPAPVQTKCSSPTTGPRVAGDDDAIRRRRQARPVRGIVPRARGQAAGRQSYEQELPGILAWAVQGCLEWQRDGLGEAEAVEQATRQYRQDEDVLGAFLAECCELGGEARAADFRAAYEDFCRDLGGEAAQCADARQATRAARVQARRRGAAKLHRAVLDAQGAG